MSDAQQTNESKFYDLHVTGIGYLNRVRLVKPSRGEPFLACSISALRGEWKKDGSVKPDSTKFDVRVYGKEAVNSIEALMPHSANKRKVMIQFKLGDIYPETFEYSRDTEYAKKGDIGMMLKGRLLKVSKAWVDGQSFLLPSATAATTEEPVAAAGGQ